MRLELDVLGVRGRVEGKGPAVAELARDFEAFAAAAPCAAPAFSVRLEPGPAMTLTGEARRWRDASFRDEDDVRLLDWAGGAASGRVELEAATATLRGEDAVLLRELGFLAAVSLAGRRLDERGWHRVHALGFERGGKGALLLLPEGGGKSTLALELLRRPGNRLLSDDAPVLGPDGRLHPFPLRLGLRPGVEAPEVPPQALRPFPRRRHGVKRLVDWSWVGARAGAPCEPRLVVAGRPGGAACRARGGRAAAAGALLEGLVVGVGLPQAAEFLWPRGPAGWAATASLAAARAAAGARLLRRCAVRALELGSEPAAAAVALERLLDDA